MNYRILLFGLVYFIVCYKAQSQPNAVTFSFSLDNAAKTSAGVFTADGALVKTLWSGVSYKAGTHKASWDGTSNDDDVLPADGNYQIKVLSNNIQAEWGLVGNTSAANSGSTVHHAADVVTSMCFAGRWGYYSVGYNEGHPGHFKFDINNPQSKIEYLPGAGQVTLFEATDGVNVYHAGQGKPPQEFIFATKVSDDSQVSFANGREGKSMTGRVYPSVIDMVSTRISTGDPNNPNIAECSIGGLAVQKNGQYLFVTHYDRNELRVYDKVTGLLVQTITSFNTAKSLAVDTNDDLWITSGTNTVTKHHVHSDGTLSAAVLTLSGLVKPLCVTVSPVGNAVAVADGGAKQQVRFFDNSTGAEGTPLGQEGGYATDATVAADKFMFKNAKEVFRDERNTFISFGLDGSMWVGDRGNYRVQHFSSTGNYIETVMNIGYFYSAAADRNNPSRVFANYLEFHIDYSKPLAPGNGSWTLVKNWSYPITYQYDAGGLNRLNCVTTLSNGRTYALQPHRYVDNNGNFLKLKWQIVELPSVGNMIFTGFEPEFAKEQFDIFYTLNADGSLIRTDPILPVVGQPVSWIKKQLTGFDAAGVPIWGPDEVIARVPALKQNDPLSLNALRPNSITSSGKIISFYPDVYDPGSGRGAGNHLGAVTVGSDKWLWQTCPSTHSQYLGTYPEDEYFDIGNGTNYAGGPMMTIDSVILWGYHGEFWKGSQTNKWSLFSDKGLFLSQFGTTGPEAALMGEAAPEMAGNALTASLSKLPNGDLVLVSADESYHGALQIWRIKGMNTVHEQNIAVYKSSGFSKFEPNYLDLMAGLPYSEIVHDNTQGWTRYPVEESVDGFNNTWSVKTNVHTYKKDEVDVTLVSYPPGNNQTQYVKRDLGANSQLKDWRITGGLSYPVDYEVGENFLDILDENDKVIVRISRPALSSNTIAIKANHSTLLEGSLDGISHFISKVQPLSISVEGENNIKVSYGDYPEITTTVFDPSANWQNPKTLRLQMHNEDRRGHQISVANLKFYKNTNVISNSYRTKSSGNWSDTNVWEYSTDGTVWNEAVVIPDASAGDIFIQYGHTVTITDSATVDQLVVQDGGTLEVSPGASISINDGPNDDVIVGPTGSLVIKSDNTGTGKIGYSTGNVVGNVTVERFIPSSGNASYRVISPSVNTTGSTKPFIRDNWQEGQNNAHADDNVNVVPQYGIHITGSFNGEQGFDATHAGDPCMFTFDQLSANPVWVPIPNTNATPLAAKTGYAIYISGDRSVNMDDPNSTSNTTLRATGTVLTGTQVFAGLEGNERISLITNPYASPINWNKIYYDPSTNHAQNFYDYCYYWDPTIGSAGGYVSIKSDGVKSAEREVDMDIQAGDVFFVRAREGVVSPSLTIKESHKASRGSADNFTGNNSAQLMTALGFKKADGASVTADGVNAVFDESYSSAVDGDDIEEIPNTTENIAILRSGKMLSIEARAVTGNSDTLKLIMQRMKTQTYFWKFQPNGFTLSDHEVYLTDKFLNKRTPISLSAPTTVSFEVNTSVAASSAQDRFLIVIAPVKVPLKISSVQANRKNNNIQVDWAVEHEANVQSYVIERSTDGRQFVQAGVVSAKAGTATSTNNYVWTDKYPYSGTSYYRVMFVDQAGTAQYSKIVDVQYNENKIGFEVYPNPVIGNTFVVQFNNLPAGNYKLKLVNNIGLVIYTKTIAHSGGSTVQTITAGQNFTTGRYTLQITGNGISYSKQLLK